MSVVEAQLETFVADRGQTPPGVGSVLTSSALRGGVGRTRE